MDIASKVERVLKEPCLCVNFSLQGAWVTGHGFGRVRKRLRSTVPGHGIDCRVDPSQKEPAYYRRFCHRRTVVRVLSFKRFDSTLLAEVGFQAAIAHECTHALLDVTGAKNTTVLTHEAAGYIMESLYGLARGGLSWRLAAGNHPIRAEAIRLIDQSGLARRSCGPPVVLSWKDYQSLRDTVHRDPVYSHLGKSEVW